MKKPRSLDHDGLDGIIPPTDKSRLKSGNPQDKTDKTLRKPMRSNVPWLLGVIGLLALIAVLLPNLMQKPAAINETAALSSQTAPVVNHASEQAIATDKVDTETPKPPAEPASTLVADATPQNAPQAAVSDAKMQAADAFPALPSEPTAAGIPKSSLDNADQATASAAFTVYFKFDSSKLTSESTNSTNQLLNAAKSCQNRIKLNGHTCNLGSDAANLQLGLARANAVKKLLTANGIGANVILTASEGMRKPAAPNDTRVGQALNRRVELQCVDN